MLRYLNNNLLYALVLVLPFTFFPGLVDSFEFPKAIIFIYTAFLAFSLYGGGILTHKVTKVKFSALHIGLSVFLVVQLISSIIGVNLRQSLWGQYYRYQGLITLISYFLFFFLISQYKKINLSFEKIYKLIGVSGLITAFLVIAQAIIYLVLKFPIYTYNGRMTALLGNSNFTSAFLTLSFIYLIFTNRTKKFNALYWFLFFAAILLTFSRSGLVAFLLASFLLFYPKKFEAKQIGVIVAIFLAVIMLFPKRDISYFDRREIIWNKAVSAFLQKPFFGWGIENFEYAFKSQIKPNEFDLSKIRVDKAHNELLEILVTSGVVGLVVWLTITGYALKKLWHYRQKEDFQINLIVLIVFIFLSQINVININSYLFYYLVLGFVAGV